MMKKQKGGGGGGGTGPRCPPLPPPPPDPPLCTLTHVQRLQAEITQVIPFLTGSLQLDSLMRNELNSPESGKTV